MEEKSELRLPRQAEQILSRLEQAGFAAYVVGGCVRDGILGRTPNDWDICTSARPEEVLRCFKGFSVLPTGLKHGTVTVMLDGQGYEVTTFRTDGSYSDGRHPDNVCFVDEVEADLSRRDFTVNAMAWSPRRGFADPFGGREDLGRGILRCVGRPEERFGEDALRILRALRFSAVYEMKADAETKETACRMAGTLERISKERITEELLKLLSASHAGRYMEEWKPVLFEVFPELRSCEGEILTHQFRTVDAVRRGEGLSEEEFVLVRLAALLHDIGRQNGETGHAERGAAWAEKALPELLRLSNRQKETVLSLIRFHEVTFCAEEQAVRQAMAKYGTELLPLLAELRRADWLSEGKGEERKEKTEELDRFVELFRVMRCKPQCVKISDLAVRGGDLMAVGVPSGQLLGQTLRELLQAVLEERLPNEKEALLAYCREKKNLS